MGFDAYYQAGFELGKRRTIATVVTSAGLCPTLRVEYVAPPACNPTPAEVIETASSATSSVSIVDAPSSMEREDEPHSECDAAKVVGRGIRSRVRKRRDGCVEDPVSCAADRLGGVSSSSNKAPLERRPKPSLKP